MSPHRRVFAFVGNRGIVLGTLGMIWMLSAIGLVVEPRQQAGLIHEQIPLPAGFAMWFIPGFLAVLAMGVKQLDEWAWMLLITPVVVRFLSYAVAWVSGTYPPGWRGGMVYAATVLLVNRCAAGLDRPAPWDGRERRAWTVERQ